MRRTTRRSLAVAGLATALLGGLILALPPGAGANPPGPHDPVGSVSAVTAVPASAGAPARVQFTGWAYDPDARTRNVSVEVLQDGRGVAGRVATSLPNATVTKKYGTGPTPAFSLVVALPAGSHTLCLVAQNVGAGLDDVLRCVPTPLGSRLSAAQLAAHSPVGAITHVGVGRASIRVQGWATDPDYVASPSVVVLYVDGSPAATADTGAYAGRPPAGAGPNSAIDITVPVASGTHLACVWVVNVGLGANSYLGCRSLDTRGPPSSAPITVPVLNGKVLAEAKTHIGQSYVWGATGPKTFDCSGLVKYSYGKFGYAVPRISEDQFAAARLIPASRVRPGDLVFTHDSEGDVYHVGIYVSPGKALAAIDEQEGVNYQSIWDPADTTYGSFTHR